MYPEGVDLSKSETSSAFQKNQTDMEFFSNFSDHPQFQKLVESSKKDMQIHEEEGYTKCEPVMFDMDPFADKKVPFTKYQESSVRACRRLGNRTAC